VSAKGRESFFIMPHKPFNIYKRPATKKNKYIFYVQFYDEEGNRLTAISSGQTSRAAAEVWAHEQLKKGIITTEKNITFGKYTQDWWLWDRCPYIQSRLLRGRRLSRRYADLMRAHLEHHILPYFENKKLQKINTRMIEQWILSLKDKTGRTGKLLSNATINQSLICLKIMLKEAVRLEYLPKNPADPILKLKADPQEKSILNREEVIQLFVEDRIDEIWNGELMHFTLNLLAASTGMRLGECQALQIQHVHQNGLIDIKHSWDPKYGLVEPKWGSNRIVPVPPKTLKHLGKHIESSPFQDPDNLVFSDENRHKPIRGELVLKSLYAAFKKIGISQEERKERNITFHSWRYFYNSLMRGRIHDSKLRLMTGHKSLEMTEHYTVLAPEDYQDVRQVQEEYFGS